MGDLTFAELRSANVARLNGDVRGCKDWSLNDWCTALTGELGEMANVLKKVRRGDFPLDEVRPMLAKELADIQTYLDLLAYRAGVDLQTATIEKFNEVSERIGSTVRLAVPVTEVTPVEPYSIGIAGVAERYRIVDGHMEIRFASDARWIRQAPSKWDKVDAWIAEAGRLRVELNTARAIIGLFEHEAPVEASVMGTHKGMTPDMVAFSRVPPSRVEASDPDPDGFYRPGSDIIGFAVEACAPTRYSERRRTEGGNTYCGALSPTNEECYWHAHKEDERHTWQRVEDSAGVAPYVEKMLPEVMAAVRPVLSKYGMLKFMESIQSLLAQPPATGRYDEPPDFDLSIQRLNMKLWKALIDAPFPAGSGEREGHDDAELAGLATNYDAWYCGPRAMALAASSEFADVVLNEPAPKSAAGQYDEIVKELDQWHSTLSIHVNSRTGAKLHTTECNGLYDLFDRAASALREAQQRIAELETKR